MKTKEIFSYSLAAFIILGYFVLIACILFHIIPKDNMEIAVGMFATLSLIVGIVVKHFFDGNKETATRDAMLYNSIPPPADAK